MSAYAVPIRAGRIDGQSTHPLRVSIENIKRIGAHEFEVPDAEMVSKRRPEWIAWPRQIAMTLAYELSPRSLEGVGEAFGGRDHGTVLHAVKHVHDREETEPEIRQQVEALRAQLRRGV